MSTSADRTNASGSPVFTSDRKGSDAGAASISYRLYENRDFSTVLSLVMDTWDFHSWVPGDAADWVGMYYLSEILEKSCRVYVAVHNDIPVGIAAVRDVHHRTVNRVYRAKRLYAYIRLLFCLHGKSEFFQFLQTEELDRELVRHAGCDFDAELTLLCVNTAYHGHGIGKLLYADFLAFLRERNYHSFFLFTDSSCDFHFYDHLGMRRMAAKFFFWKHPQGERNVIPPEDKQEIARFERRERKKGYPEEYYLYGMTVS